MSYTIINHGFWQPYTPNPLPEWAVEASTIGGSVVFFKRESDGMDFYDWMKTNVLGNNSIVAQTMNEGNSGGETVKAVFRDYSMLSPYNQRIIEIIGVDQNETKPHNTFAWLIYNPKTNTLSDEASPPQLPTIPKVTFKKDIWLRATDDEAHIIENVLSKQPLRKQKIFNEAQYLDHSDPLFVELESAFKLSFGKDRSEQLLAVS